MYLIILLNLIHFKKINHKYTIYFMLLVKLFKNSRESTTIINNSNKQIKNKLNIIIYIK